MRERLINYRLATRAAQRGLIRVLLTLSLAGASLPAISARNTAPVISGTPSSSVTVGDNYSFQPDAAGRRLRFSIRNKPAWANFSSNTGKLSGTPATDSVGIYGNIVISVSDRRSSASLPPFEIQVVDAADHTTNNAPVISGVPAPSVPSDSNYFFQPTATDADGDALSFSISNKPPWAGFDTASGSLSGTPGPGSIGTYRNIVISVSDGTARVSLPAFDIQVDAATIPTGSLTLSWNPPVARADGTPLSPADISGYRIYYGNSAGDYAGHLQLSDGTAQQVTLTDLAPGTYYVVMTTFDVNNLESGFSTEVTENVQ